MPRADALAVPPLEQRRDRVVDALTHHFAHGVLDDTEFEARLESAQRAATVAELDALVADLDQGVGPAGATIRAVLSGQERKMTGSVARELRVRARAGYVELDLARARFEPGVTEIDVGVLAGFVKILLPDDVRIESAGGALAGFFAVKGASAGPDAASTVRVTGRATMGFVECLVVPAPRPALSGPSPTAPLPAKRAAASS